LLDVIEELLYVVTCWLDTDISDDDGDNRDPENVEDALNATNGLELLNDVTHLGELRGLPIVDESRLLDKVRFMFVLLTASACDYTHTNNRAYALIE